MKKFTPVLLLLALAACKENNVVSIEKCLDSDQGAVAAVTLKDKQDNNKGYLCQFAADIPCSKVTDSSHINVVKSGLLKSECEL